MKKKILLAIVAASMLIGCGNTAVNSEVEPDSVAEVEDESDNADTEVEVESKNVVNARLEEVYLESIKKLHDDGIDLFGRQIERFSNKDEYNKISIYDVDNDGYIELILGWTDSSVAGMWGGVYQYDFDKQEYIDEGLHEPEITFYDNGVAYEPWRHNQGPGEMWPFDAYQYNEALDQYVHVLIADSWNKSMREEGFPEEADTDAVGVVYYISLDSENLNFDNPISQTEFNAVYDKYFKDANEIEIIYYEISDKGISDYQKAKK